MKYEQSIVGEKVLNELGKEGIITKLSCEGAISVRFTGEFFDGQFMFDPFLSGRLRFVNPDLQQTVDREIAKIKEKEAKLLRSSLVKKGKPETYYITKDKEDGPAEVVYRLGCGSANAHAVFDFVVSEQQSERRASGGKLKWRVVRLFDSKTGDMIRKES